jgi:hypothetical protein
MAIRSVIEKKLTQPASESKKALYAFVAAGAVLVVFSISAILILLHAEAAKEITELANLVVMFFAAIATTLITGQAVVDFKGMSVLQHIDEDQKIDSNEEAPAVEVKNFRLPRPRYYDDESL